MPLLIINYTIPLLFPTAAFTCVVQAPPPQNRGGVSICTFVLYRYYFGLLLSLALYRLRRPDEHIFGAVSVFVLLYQ
jgi:hypothetical protein